MEKQKILLLGGLSYFLSNFIRKALYEKHAYEFVSIDNVSNKNYSSNLYINKDHKFYVGDISDESLMEFIFEQEKPDIVIHGVEQSNMLNSRQFINSNILGTQIVVEKSLKYDVSKFIYLSCDKVYGELETESDASWTESDPVSPLTPFVATKIASEMLIQTSGLNYNILRFCNTYGPRQKLNKLIPKTIKSILNNEKISIYSQGLEIRNWLHIDDASSALLQILSSGKEKQIYNVSAGQEFNNIEVIQKICNIMERGHDLCSLVQDTNNNRAFRYSMKNNKIKELGWKPEHKLDIGLSLLSNWIQSNKWYTRE